MVQVSLVRAPFLDLPHRNRTTLHKEYIQFGHPLKRAPIPNPILLLRSIRLDKKLQRLNNLQSLNKADQPDIPAIDFQDIEKIDPIHLSFFIEIFVLEV